MNRAFPLGLLLGCLLSTSARAGFCQAEPFAAPFGQAYMPPPAYQGQPRDVQWTAQASRQTTDGDLSTGLSWTARDYLKDGVPWKTVMYQGLVKVSQLYTTSAARWNGGTFRATALPFHEVLGMKAEQIRATLENRDAAEARANQGKPVRVEYDAQGRPLRYVGVVGPLALETGSVMEIHITCEYAAPHRVVELLEIQSAASVSARLFTSVKTYDLDDKGRPTAYDIELRLIDGTARRGETGFYDYDSIAPRVKFTRKGESGVVREEGTFDTQGRPLSVTRRGETAPYRTWLYDGRGNWTEYRVRDVTGNFLIKRVITY